MKKIYINVLKSIGYFFLVLFLILLLEYLFSPVYKFPEPTAFKGNKIWNPYQTVTSTKWYKCNFHLHSSSWKGLTDGRNNTVSSVRNIYKLLKYDVICISNYQKIEPAADTKDMYIPVYEHGFGFQKSHQVCIGAGKVSWLDFPLYQNMHQRQFILNHLAMQNDVVAIAHPAFQRFFDITDVKYLSNYHCIEVLNHYRKSCNYWDTALSAGHPVYILADDDAHSIQNTGEVGHNFTMVFADTLNRQSIVMGLKNGHSYGVSVSQRKNETYSSLAYRHNNLAQLNSVDIQDTILKIKISKPAQAFRFIGQNGKVLLTVSNSDSAKYKISLKDTYIRTEILFSDSTTFYLNPVFRYENKTPTNFKTSEVNSNETFLFRFWMITIVFFTLYIIFRKKIFSLIR